jgi:hypothetical protein
MPSNTIWLTAAAFTAALSVCVPAQAAQSPAPPPAQRAAPAAPAPAPVQAALPVELDDRNADRTREEFRRVLEKHPPSLGSVLKLDPTLMSSPEYLVTYPALAAFLAQHPEIARNPAYFLSGVRLDGREDGPVDARARAFDSWNQMLEGLTVLSGMAIVIGSLMWLIRTMIDYRRWGRLSKVQQEVHTKLLDRFTANEDLLTYMRTPAGQKFLESAPIALDGDARPMAAPLRRILWGLQAGMVLLAGGAGLQFVAGRVPEELSAPTSALGVLAIAIGLGFLASAVASFVLSRRLGLIEEPSTSATGPGSGGPA